MVVDGELRLSVETFRTLMDVGDDGCPDGAAVFPRVVVHAEEIAQGGDAVLAHPLACVERPSQENAFSAVFLPGADELDVFGVCWVGQVLDPCPEWDDAPAELFAETELVWRRSEKWGILVPDLVDIGSETPIRSTPNPRRGGGSRPEPA